MSTADWITSQYLLYVLCCFCANVTFGLVVMLLGVSVQFTSSRISTETCDYSWYST